MVTRLKIVSYTLPRRGKKFESGEVGNAFLAQSMESERFEDSERELLSGYLNECVLPRNERAEGARSIYKYKPVALKTKPVIGELPGEF
jgi:hypothetical protein